MEKSQNDSMGELIKYDDILSSSVKKSDLENAYDGILESVNMVGDNSNALCHLTLLLTKHCTKVDRFNETIQCLEKMIDPKYMQAVRVHALRGLISICKQSEGQHQDILAEISSRMQDIQKNEKLGVMLRHMSELQGILKSTKTKEDNSVSNVVQHGAVTVVDILDHEDGNLSLRSYPTPFVYIRNLPKEANQAMVQSLIKDIAPNCTEKEMVFQEPIVLKQGETPSNGVIIMLETIQQSENVIKKINGMEFMGRTLEAYFTRGPSCRTVFVGNSRGLREQDLRNAFSEFGEIEEIQIVLHKAFSLISFRQLDGAIRAVDAMPPGSKIGNREVKVGYYVSEQRELHRKLAKESLSTQTFRLSSGRVVGIEEDVGNVVMDAEDITEKQYDLVELRINGIFDKKIGMSLFSIFSKFGPCFLSREESRNDVVVIFYDFLEDAQAAEAYLNHREFSGFGKLQIHLKLIKRGSYGDGDNYHQEYSSNQQFKGKRHITTSTTTLDSDALSSEVKDQVVQGQKTNSNHSYSSVRQVVDSENNSSFSLKQNTNTNHFKSAKNPKNEKNLNSAEDIPLDDNNFSNRSNRSTIGDGYGRQKGDPRSVVEERNENAVVYQEGSDVYQKKRRNVSQCHSKRDVDDSVHLNPYRTVSKVHHRDPSQRNKIQGDCGSSSPSVKRQHVEDQRKSDYSRKEIASFNVEFPQDRDGNPIADESAKRNAGESAKRNAGESAKRNEQNPNGQEKSLSSMGGSPGRESSNFDEEDECVVDYEVD